ncbi:MAG: 1-deoxy-D-xylulose-5-phosphate reductoisomerase [Limnochordia bacterium]|jgi:1-deoxy-D-xylulose-5-phosphate reductoisomerase
MKKLAILGATGSIGTQTLDIIRSYPDQFQVVALTARSNVELLARQALEFRPRMLAVESPAGAERLRQLVGDDFQILTGPQGLIEAATHEEAHMVITALVGAVGILPTLAAIEAGKDIGLANKETLVAAGSLTMEKARQRGVQILPIDSEHSAIFQCLQGQDKLTRIILTASGGPFRNYRQEQLEAVTPQAALQHPNWDMGGKITIDSATLMNKGLEVIEAHWLFGLDYDQIDVVIHPQSIVHSLIELGDGSVLAQLGWPDMRIPIQYALTYPQRWPTQLKPLSLTKIGTLEFAPPNRELFPCLDLAYAAGRAGGSLPAVMNAANEEAVTAFLAAKIPFTAIPRIIRAVMDKHDHQREPDLDQILLADRWARQQARQMIIELGEGGKS